MISLQLPNVNTIEVYRKKYNTSYYVSDYENDVKKGIDISSYQSGIDFSKIKEKYDFIIIRAGFTGYGGDGTNKYIDSSFETFYKLAKEYGIPVGAYYYSCANNYQKGMDEAKFLYENMLLGKQFEYPIFIDVEENRHQKVGKGLIADAIRGFIDYLESKKYYAGVYANSYYFNNYIDTASLTNYDKWLAVWSNIRPNFKYGDYGMWQNSNNGYIDNMRVDTNYAYKDYPSIMQEHELNGFINNNEIVDISEDDEVIEKEVTDEVVIDENSNVEPTTIKENTDIITEILDGKWGNGIERKQKLESAGYDYYSIQNEINKLYFKKEVIEDVYVVKKGDTLWSIALRYYNDGEKYRIIAQNNDIKNPNLIYPGQIIKLT